MLYRNTKTGAIIDSPCIISGGDWVTEDEFEDLTDAYENESEFVGKDELTEEDEEVIKLSEMSVAKLKKFAIEHEIDLGTAKKKDDIIKVILASQE